MLKFYKLLFSICLFLFLTNCAGVRGWPEYKQAMKCHLKKDGTDCSEYYKVAISKNENLPGLNASYGSHLYSRGNLDEGVTYFEIETKKFPQSQKAISVVTKPSSATESSTTTETDNSVQNPVKEEKSE